MKLTEPPTEPQAHPLTPEAEAELTAKAKTVLAGVLKKPSQFPAARGLQCYTPRTSDIVVTTFPKSGTTLTQQLVYQVVIATGGAHVSDPSGVNFSDVCEVVPWVDFGPDHGFPPFESSPRVFKSHLPANAFATRAQNHLVVIRDPRAYPASWLDFLFDLWSESPVSHPFAREVVFREFVQVRLFGKGEAFGFPYEKVDHHGQNGRENNVLPVGPWFMHARTWLERSRDEKVLIMFYEDIIADIGCAADRVAKFMGRALSDEGRDVVRQRCSREYMAKDPKFGCQLEAKALGFPPNAMKAKPNSRNGFKQFKLNDEECKGIDDRISQEFGYSCYEDLRTNVNRIQASVHG